jgi:hypothetical protein
MTICSKHVQYLTASPIEDSVRRHLALLPRVNVKANSPRQGLIDILYTRNQEKCRGEMQIYNNKDCIQDTPAPQTPHSFT